MTTLGYKDIHNGICVGYSAMLIQALCLGKKGINDFIKRMEMIDKINFISKEDDTFNLELNQHSDIMAFFDCIYLMQRPEKFTNLFANYYNHANLNAIYKYVNSLSQENEITFVQSIYTHYLAKNYLKLKDYLTGLEQIACSLHENLVIEISAFNHNLVVFYEVEQKIWHLYDVNLLPSIEEQTKFSVRLSILILTALGEDLNKALDTKYGVFKTTFYMFNNRDISNFQFLLSELHNEVEPSDADKVNSKGINTLRLTLQDENLSAFRTLVKHGITLPVNSNNISIFDILSEMNNEEFVDYLLSQLNRLGISQHEVIICWVIYGKTDLLKEKFLNEFLNKKTLDKALEKLDYCVVDGFEMNLLVYYYLIQTIAPKILNSKKSISSFELFWQEVNAIKFFSQTRFCDYQAIGMSLCKKWYTQYKKSIHGPFFSSEVIHDYDSYLLNNYDHILRFVKDDEIDWLYASLRSTV